MWCAVRPRGRAGRASPPARTGSARARAAGGRADGGGRPRRPRPPPRRPPPAIPASVSTPAARPPRTPIRRTGVASRSSPPTACQPPHERLDQRVEAAARMPRAPGMLDVPGHGQRGRGAARVRAGVRREPLDHHLQPRIGRVPAASAAASPRLHAREVEWRRAGCAARPPGRPRRRAGQHRLAGPPHGRGGGQEAEPLGPGARPPGVERGARAAGSADSSTLVPSAKP